jgi:hypothetical protein
MQWVARYNDETSLPQYNGDGSENKYSDIDRRKLVSFTLTEQVEDKNIHVLSLHLEPTQRLVYRRRVEMVPGEEPVVIYLVGWQQTIQDGSPDGRNIQSIGCVFPDLHIEWFGEFRDNHRWFYPVQPFDCEQGEK